MKNITLLILCLIISPMGFSQDIEKKKSAVIISVGQQVDGVTYDVGALQTIDKTLFQPRIEAGYERTWKDKKNFRLYQDFKFTFVNDPYIERVYGFGTDLGFEFKILKRILLTPRFGVHGNLAKPSDVQYVYQNEKWEQTSNKSQTNNRVFIKTGLDFGYRINKKYDVFVFGQYSVNLPHIKDFMPINLNKAAGVGIRYSLF